MNLSAFFVIAVAIVVALTMSISPEEPFQRLESVSKNTVEYIGGDGKTTLRGHWHYMHSNANVENEEYDGPGPVIVMAHGFGLTQTQGLHNYITAFQKAGMNVFTFDYATFGQSDGVPRHQVCPKSHVADLRSTVEMITARIHTSTTMEEVDPNRIGLWGTSLGGGHVLQLASDSSFIRQHPSVRAIISQVPHLTLGLQSLVIPSIQQTPIDAIKGLGFFALALIKWSLYRLFLNKPSYYPLVGMPGSPAMMQNPGDYAGYFRLVEAEKDANSYGTRTDAHASEIGTGWTNAATTVSGLKIVLQYRPIQNVDSIVTPTLLIATENDTLCPAKFVKEAHNKIPQSEYYEAQHMGHFDIYGGREFQVILEKEILFFQKYLHGV